MNTLEFGCRPARRASRCRRQSVQGSLDGKRCPEKTAILGVNSFSERPLWRFGSGWHRLAKSIPDILAWWKAQTAISQPKPFLPGSTTAQGPILLMANIDHLAANETRHILSELKQIGLGGVFLTTEALGTSLCYGPEAVANCDRTLIVSQFDDPELWQDGPDHLCCLQHRMSATGRIAHFNANRGCP